MFLEIAIVLVLILANGLLAMSELALVSARPARLKVMADGGSRGAAVALQLTGHPGRFLSTVQIGITLVGVLSGAYSGATLGVRLADTLAAAGTAPALARTMGVGGVVIVITYLALIIGELVPKQVALRAPEAVAARVAPLMQALALAAAPLVWLLDHSGRLVLDLLGQSREAEGNMTDEEVRMVIAEARRSGIMEPAETEMIAGVMRIADRTARGLMTPRRKVEMVDVTDSASSIIERFRATRRSRLPVRDGEGDNLIGVLTTTDFLDRPPPRDETELRSLIIPTPVVQDWMAALDVIEMLRQTPANMVFVYDEYGHFEGIITAMDLLEAITGDFTGEPGGEEEEVIERADGSLIVAGSMPVDEFADRIGITLPVDRGYQTVAGLVLDLAGRLPDVGESLIHMGWRIEILDLDERRIDKVLVSRAGERVAPDGSQPGADDRGE
ncbi:hemolysin family protein [Limibaculum sp. FT325]|uniref:hemolysin family protein n=1 Tax=Thermohalobaculum sediminis TaxID=2939436 RepID=UPI0020BF0C7C|nr:hemolysin family protein [Limibaculum sediminis]MCL5778203.1 hemolysin family protein [Limibaculum sediminis]